MIEDEPVQRMLLRLQLKRQSYEVTEAADGQAGVQIVLDKAKEIDIIISDFNMPGLNGRGVWEALHSSIATQNIPFILYSAVMDERGVTFSHPDIQFLAKQQGVRLVAKGATVRRLTEVMEDLLQAAHQQGRGSMIAH